MSGLFYSSDGYGFRKVEQQDLSTLKDLKNTTWDSTVQLACLNDLDQTKWFERVSPDSKSLYLIIVAQGNLDVGFWALTDIDWLNRSCAFSHAIFEQHRGNGHGKNSLKAGLDLAFRVFNMNRVETYILSNNAKELTCAEKAGMKVEGIRRKAVYRNGYFLDCLLLGILREDWEINA